METLELYSRNNNDQFSTCKLNNADTALEVIESNITTIISGNTPEYSNGKVSTQKVNKVLPAVNKKYLYFGGFDHNADKYFDVDINKGYIPSMVMIINNIFLQNSVLVMVCLES
jgi:hypothetical protein